MAKQRVANYIFLPGVGSNSNLYPNAYALIKSNLDFIRAEAVAFISTNIASDNASNLYPNAVTLLTNNKQFIIDEIQAWIAAQIAAATVGTTWYNYSYSVSACRRDLSYLLDAYIYDIKYGGNEQTMYIAKQFWQGGAAQLISPTQEIIGFNQVINIINNYILPRNVYTSQQSPVTSYQNTNPPTAESGVTALMTSLGSIISNVITGGLSSLPSTTYSTKNFAGYVFDSAKCYRDIGLVIEGYLNDLRYGGNAQIRFIASRFWHGDIPQLGGDRKPEITAQGFIRDLITNTILTGAAYTPYQTSTPRITTTNTIESGSIARITSLANGFINVVTNGLSVLPTLTNGVTTIKLQGKYELEQLLLITNTTSNTVMYNFADPTLGATISYASTNNSGIGDPYSDDFPAYRNTADYVTTITLAADTSSASVSDDIQIFVEAKEMRIRPYDYGTDAIERQRVAQPQAMLDADFEYGLQPTKWQAIGISRGYPSVYEIPGTDTQVVSVVTDASVGTSGVGESLITVTTAGAHGFTVGTPFTIKSLANTITGFNRAEGTFIIISVPNSTSFTYYATSKVGTSNGQVLATSYTQLRKGAFYTGAAIGQPVFSVFSNGIISSFVSQFITSAGSDQMAFIGTPPAIGVPVSATGITAGTQVTGTVGSGGLVQTSTVRTTVAAGATVITLTDPTGVLEGMALDNGAGVSTFVSNITGNDVNITSPMQIALTGALQVYTNVSGNNILPSGSGATFTVERVNGVYDTVTVVSVGSGYKVNDEILILGAALGGASPDNNLTITVSGIDGSGGITSSTYAGTSVSGDASYANLVPNSTSGSGVNATFNIDRVNGVYTGSFNNAGANYQIGDTITISGAQVGGASPTNDVTLTVVNVLPSTGELLYVSVSGTGIPSNQTYTGISGTNILPTGTGASFDITRSGGSYTAVISQVGTNYKTNDKILISGSVLSGSSPTNDAVITITGVAPVTGTISTFSIAGVGVSGSSIGFYSAVAFSDITTATIANATTISTSAIATIQVSFSSNHGLVPGANLLVSITSTGTNHLYAQGPFYVEQVPSPTTIRYTARTIGTIDTGTSLTGIVYARPESFFIHRPFDGGVQLGTGGPAHGDQAIRMSKKYIRYQSGKGVNYCTGALFAPSYTIQSLVADGTSIGSFITIVTDDVDHGCQVGGRIKIDGIETKGYNGVYDITDIINERTFKVQATTVLANLVAILTTNAQMSILKWHGATVRAGTFDDQNGLFMQYDGQNFAVGRRSSTFQLTGTVSVNRDSNIVTGTSSRFRDQIKAGDRITIRGMTHVVSFVASNFSMTITPDYRGASNAVNAKACLIQEFIIPQSQFNIDRLDGTGPSGYNLDVTKMQMIGMQWSWYAVGFIDFMMRGSDGNFVFFHRIRNSNVNTEAYMRTGNQPVRYEVINESGKSKLANSISATQTTITLTDASMFPNEAGIVYIDNELIKFSGKTGNTLTGCTRSAPMVNFVGGAQRTFTAGAATTHEYNTGVILVSNTISPIISHWGSAMLTDGLFDNDRGYLFNYASTGIQVSTTVQTAFLIRLAPSVSNAIIGDLGDRELLNRAQLLLQEIEITSDSGSGGIIVNGVLNPQNYPIDPTAISWSGLSSSGAGGQPSFAQVAPGGSVSWAGGASTTTSTATTTAALTGTALGLSNSAFNVAANTNTIYVSKTSWDTLGASAGFSVAATETKFPNGTTISSVAANPSPIATTLGLIVGSATMPNFATINAGANYMYFSQSTWEALKAGVSSTVYGSKDFPAGTTVTSVSGPSIASGISYYLVYFSQNSLIAHSVGSQIQFYIGGVSTSGTNKLLFTQSSWSGLPISSAVLNNTVDDTSKFTVGTSITAISTLQTFAGVNYYTVTFSTNLLTTLPASTSVTFTYTPYYTLTLSKNSSVPIGYATATSCTISTNILTIGGTITGYFSIGMLITGAGVTANSYILTQTSGPAGGAGNYTVSQTSTVSSIGITGTPVISFTPAIISSSTSFLYFTQASWEALVSTYGAAAGTTVADTAKFPSNTSISSISALSSFAGTSYYRVNFTQSAIASIGTGVTVTFSFGLPPYALPGETVFSFIAAPGTTSKLDLSGLKELTNTTLGGRGTYPNGPDVLAINLYRASGTGSIPTNVVVRWGEAQA